MGAFLSRRLDKLDLIALFLDGIEFASHTVIVALGVTADGTKVPLGLWLGSTENATICTELVQSLVARGLKVDRPMLCVIDGGQGDPQGAARRARHERGDPAVPSPQASQRP
jgi:transposase-like protein